ncbi:MAG: hypothetical protein ACR2NN_21375 [Bryobacteraceae bacterium]
MNPKFPVTVTYSARGVPTFQCEVSHDGLHKFAVIRSGDREVLAKKVLAQVMQWNATWGKLSASARAARLLASQKEIAHERTTEAQRLLQTHRDTLIAGIKVDPAIDWEQRKVETPFPDNPPNKPNLGPRRLPSVCAS